MHLIFHLGLCSLGLFKSLISCLTLAQSDGFSQWPTRSLTTQTRDGIASLICPNSTILTPADVGWIDEQERYMQNIDPQVQLSVIPGCESDIPKIIKYANRHNISFYAVSRGHALTTSVGQFFGIEINLRALNRMRINPGNDTAHFQGGVYTGEVIEYLWNEGFVTATAAASCVSILGPALGGGHNIQQGKHGLTADHLVNLNIVLANGTAISVNEESHSDLWWAMRGAGHNFGIVTNFDSKIWPDTSKQYYIKTYQFSGKSLEPLVEQVNWFQGNGTLSPTWFGSFGSYVMNPNISKTEPTIVWLFLYDGLPSVDAKAALKPFDDLSPLTVDEAIVPYNMINERVGGAINGTLCEPNKTHIVGTAQLLTNNITIMRAIYDLYTDKMRQQSSISYASVLIEGYAMQGVQSFNSNDSAYPFRAENLLTYFDVRFDTKDDPLIGFAEEWRDQTVALWNTGQPNQQPTTYVNYAAGYESLEARYGYEPWRLARLRRLKSQYDPQNKFAWYNPIIPPKNHHSWRENTLLQT